MITPWRAGFMALATTCLRAQEHAFQVHVDRELPFLDGALLQGLVLRRTEHVAGVVDEDVDLAELGEHRVDHRLDLRFESHVALDPECPAARRLGDIRGGFLRVGEFAAGDRHVGARLGQGQGHVVAEVSGPAGDNRHLPGQIEQVHDVHGSITLAPFN